MADTISRRCVFLPDLWSSTYPRGANLTFYTEPCSFEAACAHLEMFHPRGAVVRLSAKRGPRGGTGQPRFATQAWMLRKPWSLCTFHISLTEAPDEFHTR